LLPLRSHAWSTHWASAKTAKSGWCVLRPGRLVVTFGSALLLAASLENGGIQIQTEAFFWLLKQRQKPTPKRLQRPPKGVTALGVERIWTGFDPKTERKPESIVLC
jgi:hypothetical protein